MSLNLTLSFREVRWDGPVEIVYWTDVFHLSFPDRLNPMWRHIWGCTLGQLLVDQSGADTREDLQMGVRYLAQHPEEFKEPIDVVLRDLRDVAWAAEDYSKAVWRWEA